MTDSRKSERVKQWEKYGFEAIEADLIAGGIRLVGGPPEVREQAWEWVRTQKAAYKAGAIRGELTSAKAILLLERLYESPGAQQTPIFLTSLATDCGLTEQEAKDAWHYLKDKRYIGTYSLAYSATISATGIDLVERGRNEMPTVSGMKSRIEDKKTQIAVLMSLDVEKSSSIAGDLQKLDLAKFLGRLQRKIRDDCQLLICKSTGDGLFVCGSDMREMCEAALSIRDEFKNKEWLREGYARPLRPRIALHLAQVTLIWDDGKISEISGAGATKVARIEPVVEPGEVWCSDLLALAIEQEELASIKTVALGVRELVKEAGATILHRIIRSHEIPTPSPGGQQEDSTRKSVHITERLSPRSLSVADVLCFGLDAVDSIGALLTLKMDAVVAIDPVRRSAQHRATRGRFELNFSLHGEVKTACKVWFHQADSTLCMFVGMLDLYDDSLVTFQIPVAQDEFSVHITTPAGIGEAGTKWSVQRTADKLWEIFFSAIHSAYSD